MIRAQDLAVRYGEVLALHDLTLETAQGSVLGLIGPNGSGKSTALRALLGAVRLAGGRASIDGDEVGRLPGRELARRLAVLAQEEPPSLPLTAWDTVLLGRSVHLSGWASYREVDREAAREALRATGALHLAERFMTELSGGERQRVLIARAVAQSATHLLLDEPTNHLDVRYQHEILALVQGLGLDTVVVLHDLNLAARYCDRLVLLHAGGVVASGDPDQVLRPEILEPVYGIGVRRVDVEEVPQLVFSLAVTPVP